MERRYWRASSVSYSNPAKRPLLQVLRLITSGQESQKALSAIYLGQQKRNGSKKGETSGLHVVIIDEIDAMCGRHFSGGGDDSGGTKYRDSTVNQLLAKMDGVQSINNILLIGMKN